MQVNIGELVTRKSYNSDIIFRVEKISGQKIMLRSFRLRLMADAPLEDLIKVKDKGFSLLKKELLLESFDYLQRQQKHLILSSRQVRKKNPENTFQEYQVKVLHFDGDKDYLELSLANYNNLNISAWGFFVPERGQPKKISEYLKEYRPDILVLTGHDGELNGRLFHTSNFFIGAVEAARSFEPNLDNLVIFAGACQSNYERLIASGANFASSPENKLIHFLDPILIVEKIVFTSIREVIPVKDVIKNTITGEGGVGGIETRGKLRLRYP